MTRSPPWAFVVRHTETGGSNLGNHSRFAHPMSSKHGGANKTCLDRIGECRRSTQRFANDGYRKRTCGGQVGANKGRCIRIIQGDGIQCGTVHDSLGGRNSDSLSAVGDACKGRRPQSCKSALCPTAKTRTWPDECPRRTAKDPGPALLWLADITVTEYEPLAGVFTTFVIAGMSTVKRTPVTAVPKAGARRHHDRIRTHGNRRGLCNACLLYAVNCATSNEVPPRRLRAE